MYAYCSTIHNSKDWEPTQMSINDRLDKENVIHWEAEVCGSQGQEIETILVNMVKPRLY